MALCKGKEEERRMCISNAPPRSGLPELTGTTVAPEASQKRMRSNRESMTARHWVQSRKRRSRPHPRSHPPSSNPNVDDCFVVETRYISSINQS